MPVLRLGSCSWFFPCLPGQEAFQHLLPGAVQPHPHIREGDPGQPRDLFAAQALELEENNHGSVLLTNAVENAVKGARRFAPLEQGERVRLAVGQLREIVPGAGPARLAPDDARRPPAPPPAAAPIANDPKRDLVEPGRDVSVAAPLVETALNTSWTMSSTSIRGPPKRRAQRATSSAWRL